MKKHIIFTPVLLFLVLLMGCAEDSSVDEHRDIRPVIEVVMPVGETQKGRAFTIKGDGLKAGIETENTNLEFKYINGYGRNGRIKVTQSNKIISGSVAVTFEQGDKQGVASVSLSGTPTSMGALEIVVSILAEGMSPVTHRFDVMVGDPKPNYQITWTDADLKEGTNMIMNVESSAILEIPYKRGYGRNVGVQITSDAGIVAMETVRLNGDYENNQEGEAGVMEIPLTGTPNVDGSVRLDIVITSLGGVEVDGSCSIVVEENTEELPTTMFEDELSSTGILYKNVGVGVKDVVLLNLPYTNGYAREYKVKAATVSGIEIIEYIVKLEAGGNDNILEIPVSGTPTVLGDIVLEVTLTPVDIEDGLPTVTRDVILDVVAPESVIFTETAQSGGLFAGVSSKNHIVTLSYENGYGREVTPNIIFFDPTVASGLTAEVQGLSDDKLTLESIGTLNIKFTGDTPVVGSYPCTLELLSEGEASVTHAFTIVVTDDQPALFFNLVKSTLSGTPLINGTAIEQGTGQTTLRIPYSNGFSRTVHSIEVSGMVNGSLGEIVLESGVAANYVEIPLNGTPTQQMGSFTITIIETEGGKVQKSKITAFAGDLITYNNLSYYTVFIDFNENGVVDPTEVWLDRNIGATSNDPGGSGNFNDNLDCVGNYYNFGKAYSEFAKVIIVPVGVANAGRHYPEKDASYRLPVDPMIWDICPEGYRVPSTKELCDISDYVLGTTYAATNKVEGISKYPTGGTATPLINSVLRIPLSGVMNADLGQNSGSSVALWSNTYKGTTPIAACYQTNQTNMNLTASAMQNLRANVRCIKN